MLVVLSEGGAKKFVNEARLYYHILRKKLIIWVLGDIMKLCRSLLKTALVSMFSFVITVGANDAFAVKNGDSYPAIATKHRSKGTLTKAAIKDHVTIINFWATWCAACKVELVEMKKLFAPLSKNKKVKFAFVSLDKDTGKAAKYIDSSFGKDSLIGSNLFYDPSFELAESFELASFPTTLVIGPDGKVILVQEGFKEGNGSTEKIVALAEKTAKK